MNQTMNNAPESKNVFVDLIDIIAAPGQALRRISFYPRSWWFPALLAILSALILLWVSLPVLIDQAQTMAQLQLTNQNLSPEQLEATQQMVERLARASVYVHSECDWHASWYAVSLGIQYAVHLS